MPPPPAEPGRDQEGRRARRSSRGRRPRASRQGRRGRRQADRGRDRRDQAAARRRAGRWRSSRRSARSAASTSARWASRSRSASRDGRSSSAARAARRRSRPTPRRSSPSWMPSREEVSRRAGRRGAAADGPARRDRPRAIRDSWGLAASRVRVILLPPARMGLRSRTRIECGFRRRIQDRRLSRADANGSSPPPNLMCDRTISQGRTTYDTGVSRRTDRLAGHVLSIPRPPNAHARSSPDGGGRCRRDSGRAARPSGSTGIGRSARPGLRPGLRDPARPAGEVTQVLESALHRSRPGSPPRIPARRGPLQRSYHPDASDGGRS